MRKNNSQITAGFNEGINGAKTTKTLVREELNIQEFETVSASMRSASIRAATLSNLFLPIVASLGSLATAYALWQGGNSVIGGTHVFGVAMTVGTLTMFINYTVSFFQPVRYCPHLRARSSRGAKKGSRGNAPCRVKGRRPWWGLGQRPNCSSGDQQRKRAQQKAQAAKRPCQ